MQKTQNSQRSKKGRKRQDGILTQSNVQTKAHTFNLFPKRVHEVSMYKTLTPNEVVVKFMYTPTFVLSNNGFPNASRSFVANGLYDVDPALASTSVLGFTEWMSLYFNYRVLNIYYSVEFIVLDQGNTGVPLIACMSFHNTGFSANTFTEAYFNNPLAQSFICSRFEAGKRSGSASVEEIHGTPGTLTDGIWAGTLNSNPVEAVYLTAAVSSVGIATTLPVGGLVMKLTIKFDTLLSHRKTLDQ